MSRARTAFAVSSALRAKASAWSTSPCHNVNADKLHRKLHSTVRSPFCRTRRSASSRLR
jgi:hypothetical protein